MVRNAVWIAALCVLAAAAAGCQREASGGSEDASPSGQAAGPPPVDVKAAIEALGPPASKDVQALYEGEFEAVGSEPFWRLDILSDWVAFVRPGLPEAGSLPVRREARANGALIVAGPLIVTLKIGECTHASGETFPYLAKVDFDGVGYEGCARRGVGASSTTPEWTSVLSELLPAIDACLARVERTPGRITIAYLLDNGDASVRLVDNDGGRYECGAEASGVVSYWGAIGDRDVLQGEREPLFTRAPDPAPKGECLTSEAAPGPDGPLGWTTRRTC